MKPFKPKEFKKPDTIDVKKEEEEKHDPPKTQSARPVPPEIYHPPKIEKLAPVKKEYVVHDVPQPPVEKPESKLIQSCIQFKEKYFITL